MNAIQAIMEHRSVRRFTKKYTTKEQRDVMAATTALGLGSAKENSGCLHNNRCFLRKS